MDSDAEMRTTGSSLLSECYSIIDVRPPSRASSPTVELKLSRADDRREAAPRIMDADVDRRRGGAAASAASVEPTPLSASGVRETRCLVAWLP